MSAYYNEHDKFAAAWLRELIKAGLITDGEVDERDIQDVRCDDLRGFAQCHFFAGIGGWSYALRLAGWEDAKEVWTGSCPCQPFSSAASIHGRKGFDDPRHLWPVWARLIAERRPANVFGEQSAAASAWLALVRRDLEAMGYAVGCLPIQAACVGADHERDRYWFVADTNRHSQRVRAFDAEMAEAPALPLFANTDGEPMERSTESWRECGHWADQPGVDCVAYGVPDRVAKLRCLGNAIVPQVAAIFIQAYCEARGLA